MSHYRVIVVLPKPPAAPAGTALSDALLRDLLPLLGEPDYAGEDTDPPGRWWDRWMIGGRFENAFLCTNPDDARVMPAEGAEDGAEGGPRMVTAAPVSLLDFHAQRDAVSRQAADTWDRATGILRSHPGTEPLSVFLLRGDERAERMSPGSTAARFGTPERRIADAEEMAARKAYLAQAGVRELREAGLPRVPGCEVDRYAAPREEFVEQARLGAVTGWAVIDTDGTWYDMAHLPETGDHAGARRARREYLRLANALLDSVPDDAYLVAADVHA